jgi:hypothetical protein
MAKCKHRKRVLLATASDVEFTPDQEPYTDGVIEHSGYARIIVESINMHWCPKCECVQDIEIDGEVIPIEEP